MDSLITDIDALISKEREYMEYLDGCMFSINYIIVRTQAVVRGWIVRKNIKNF